MKNTILKLELWGILFIILFGSLLHFTFEWSNRNFLVGVFSAVNESTWEHLKLAVIPAIIWMLIEMRVLKNKPDNFIFTKVKGIYLMPVSIIILFYSYKAIFGRNYLALDILIFVIAVILGQFFSYKLMFSRKVPKVYKRIAIVFLFLLLGSFVIFTFYPPRNFLFLDPIDLKYGI